MVGAVLNAQGSGAPWNDLRSKNPLGVSITQRLVNPHAFRQGELIAAPEMLPARDVAPWTTRSSSRCPALRWVVSMAAVARYATAKALPRIRAIYESQQELGLPELMAYFVRVDPAYSERLFRGHAWDMHVALCAARCSPSTARRLWR